MIVRRALLQGHRLTEREQKNLDLLELIRQQGPITRTELSKGSGFNIVTVSNYVKDFIGQGLVVERGFDVSTGGRKPGLVELNRQAGYAVGIDLGPMDYSPIVMKGVIADLHGTAVHHLVKPRPAESMEKVLACAQEMVRELIATSSIDARKIRGICIGVPGIVDEHAGTVRHTARGGVRTSYGELRNRCETEFKVPVFVGSDAGLAGYGEYRLGLDQPVENMVYMYSDIGACLVVHGHVYWGAGGSAGELGVHIPSEDDYLTWIQAPSFVTTNDWDLHLAAQAKRLVEEGHGSSIRQLVQDQPEAIGLDTVIQAAQGGDHLAQELIEHAGMKLGIRIASIVNLMNPEVVVIGGGIERAGSLLLEPVWRAVKRYAYEEPASLVDVLPAKLGEHAVAMGAACWVIREIFIQA